ncbi:MAG: hypothetical protein U0361_22930 [Nitrospiraceae bacterium]
MTKRKIIAGFSLYAILVLVAFAPLLGEAVSKIQVNTDSAQIISNKTLDSSNTYNGGTFNSQTLTTPTLSTPTWSSGAFMLTPLNANSLLYLNASKQLSSTANPTNGQFLIGSTGTIPALGTLTGTANQIAVTNGAGTITLSTPQNIGTASSPTFAGLTVTGVTANKIVTTNGSNALAPLSSAIGVSDGGTGVNSTPSNGNLLIGNGTGYTVAGLTAGGAIAVTNGTGSIRVSAIERGYLGGYTMSTAGSSATMTIAAGQATDSTNAAVITLGSSIAKTTGSWAVGTGNGCLGTGSVTTATWYHFYAIYRSDTLVVDVLCSLSASAPTLPAGYTHKRRIGAGKTDGSSQWIAFSQVGDEFLWSTGVLDVNTTNPGTSAVNSALSVPSGVKVYAVIRRIVTTGAGGAVSDLVSPIDQADAAPSLTAAPGATLYVPASSNGASLLIVRTDTSRQVRSRLSFSDGSTISKMVTVGWIDRRERES